MLPRYDKDLVRVDSSVLARMLQIIVRRTLPEGRHIEAV